MERSKEAKRSRASQAIWVSQSQASHRLPNSVFEARPGWLRLNRPLWFRFMYGALSSCRCVIMTMTQSSRWKLQTLQRQNTSAGGNVLVNLVSFLRPCTPNIILLDFCLRSEWLKGRSSESHWPKVNARIQLDFLTLLMLQYPLLILCYPLVSCSFVILAFPLSSLAVCLSLTLKSPNCRHNKPASRNSILLCPLAGFEHKRILSPNQQHLFKSTKIETSPCVRSPI